MVPVRPVMPVRAGLRGSSWYRW